MSDSIGAPSRRRLLMSGAGLVGGVALGGAGMSGTASAASITAGASVWSGGTSANGWPVIPEPEARRIEGSDIDVTVRPGDVATVLLHVARRYYYEIDTLRKGEVSGHGASREIAQPYESNYLSGTAIAIRPGSYPVGVKEGFFPLELMVIRDILAECKGVVRWGGDEEIPKESHFQIDVGPGDRRLENFADQISAWHLRPGQGAGSIDPFTAARRSASQRMERKQRVA